MKMTKDIAVKLGAAFVAVGLTGAAIASYAEEIADAGASVCDTLMCQEIGTAIANDPYFKPYTEFFNHYGPLLQEEGRKQFERIQQIETGQNPSP